MNKLLKKELKEYLKIDDSEIKFLDEYFTSYEIHVALAHTKKWFGDMDVSLEEKKEEFIKTLKI